MKRTLSLILSLLMVFGVFSALSVGAAEESAVADGDIDTIPQSPDDDSSLSQSEPSDLAATGFEEFDLWVGATRVNQYNCMNILGDGRKAVYTPQTKTLTFYYGSSPDPEIPGSHNNAKIYSEIDGLTIDFYDGYPLSSNYTNCFIYSTGSLTVKSNGYSYIRGTANAIYAKKDLTITGYLKAIGMSREAVLVGGTLDISSLETEYFEAQGGTAAIRAKSILYDSSQLKLMTPYNPGKIGTDPDAVGYQTVLTAENTLADHAQFKKYSGEESYNLWLGSRLVTKYNCNDIFGDGKASYNPDTHTLTLKNPTIPGVHESTKINCWKTTLTIKGSYHMTQDDLKDTYYGVEGGSSVSGNKLTLDGNFTFYGKSYGVKSNNDLTIKSGSVRAIGEKECGIAVLDGNLDIQSGVSKIDAEGGEKAIFARPEMKLGDGLVVTTPVYGKVYKPMYYNTNYIVDRNNKEAQHAIIEPSVAYDLWLGATQVTNVNSMDILKDGTAVYDRATKTLTLNDPTFSGTYNSAKIYCREELTVKGSYTMSSPEDHIGIWSYGSLTLDGSFTFRGRRNGVNTQGDLSIPSGKLTAISKNEDAIVADGKITVGKKVSRVEAQGGTYAVSAKTITLAEGFIIDVPYNGKIGQDPKFAQYQTVCNSDGTVANHAVFSLFSKYSLWVGATQVTDSNKTDILGDGKAQYDSDTHTLTLNDPTITDSYYPPSSFFGYRVYAAMDDPLTVTGSYHMEYDDDIINGIYSYTDLTLAGDFQFYGRSAGIRTKNKLIVHSGTLTSIGYAEFGIECAYLRVDDEVTRVTMKSSVPIKMKNCSFGDSVAITQPVAGAVRPSADNSYLTIRDYKEKIPYSATIEHVTNYDLWLGRTRVNNVHQNDIFGDGTAKYDPETKTLTLKNPTISGEHNYSKIYSALTYLKLNGSCEIPEEDVGTYGLRALGKVYMNGNFTIRGLLYGIDVTDWLSVESGTLLAEATGDPYAGLTLYGIRCEGYLVLDDGALRFEAKGGSYAVLCKEFYPSDRLSPVPAELTAVDDPSKKFKLLTLIDGSTNVIATKAVYENTGKKTILGDVDGDGEVTIIDATYIQRKLADLPVQSYDAAAADTDRDGDVTILDATAIQRYIAGLSAPAGIGKPI